MICCFLKWHEPHQIQLHYNSHMQYIQLVFIVATAVLICFGMIQVDPSTGEAEEEGVEDEYQLEDLEVVSADYMLKVGVSNFKNAWESLGSECERVDEYGLGVRESLAEAVSAVINILGMQPCEVSLLLLFISPTNLIFPNIPALQVL